MAVVVPTSSRHLTARGERPGGTAFAKAPRSPAHREDLLREAAVYDVLRDRCPATSARVPREARWNPDTGQLEMEALEATALADHVAAARTLSPVVAASVGRAIGELHGEGVQPGPDTPRSDWLEGGVGIVRPTPRRLRLLSAGGIQLLKLLQRSDGLEADLSALAPPAHDALVHGDLRWENVLLMGGSDEIRLVDWEMGGAGERAWDTGCFAAACVSAWLYSFPSVPGLPPARLAAEARLPLDALELGLNAFWTAYRDAWPGGEPDAWSARCAQLAAVRLVYLGFEAALPDMELRALPVAHLQVAAHVLEDPVRAAHELLGMA